MSKILLNVSHLGVELDGKVVLEDLNFDLREQETLVVLGPNGAGKTVLMRALLELLPYSGQISWQAGLRLGYVPQRVPLNREMPLTVADFFELKKVESANLPELLRQVGITESEILDQQLGLLSSGQFQRVLIAWALANNPNVLLFDEPTAGIDIGGEETIHNLLARTQRERLLSVILVTHDLSTVYSAATKVLCINRKVFCYGPPSDILDSSVLQDLYGTDVKLYRHDHE